MSEHAIAQPQKATIHAGALEHRTVNQPEPTTLPGRLFDAVSSTFMEPRFAHDFSRVRLRAEQPMVQRLPRKESPASAPAIAGPTVWETPTPEPTAEPAGPTTEATPTPAPAEPMTEPATPGETLAPGLLVEDSVDEFAPGQMKKSDFLAQLRTAVSHTAEAALAGTDRTTADCPYLGYWFGYYSLRDSAHIERAIHRYAPETRSATSPREYISIITGRVRQSVETWVRTGEITGVPEGVPTTLPSEAPTENGEGAVTVTGPVMLKKREGGARATDDPQAIQAQLGEGRPLDSGVRSRMESAFGMDFAHVRTHTNSTATGLSCRLNARAFTVGEQVAFGANEYKPGTLIGDALIAHELAHVVQQRGASASVAPMQTGDTSYNMLENDADKSAIGAIVSLWDGAKGGLADIAQNAMPRLRSGLKLQRCAKKTPDGVTLGPTDKTKTFCLKPSSFKTTFSVDKNTSTNAQGRQDIKFEGLNTGKQGAKTCSCDCGLYRHWIKGYWRTGSAKSAKQYGTSSCGHSITINESTFTEEYTSCIGDNDPDACKWAYADAPGSLRLSNGTYDEVHYSFKYEIWDRCQNKSAATKQKTLDISGDTAPRTIRWT